MCSGPDIQTGLAGWVMKGLGAMAKKKYKLTLDYTGDHGWVTKTIGEFATRKAVNAELTKRDKMQEEFISQPNSDDLIVPDEIKHWEGGDTFVEEMETGKRWFVNNIYEGMKWELEENV